MLNHDQARIHTFEVVPSLPEPLAPLLDIAYNLWWSWHPEAVELFVRLDRELWEQTRHNPVRLLGACAQETLDRAARDEGYLTCLNRALQNLQMHLDRRAWFQESSGGKPFTIAYFSAEFALTECLRIYSGGLGCLAGDHLKSASELGIPLIGVGLLYRHGYFQQYLNSDGWQQEYLVDLEFENQPIIPVKDDSGRQLKVYVRLPGRDVAVAVWKALVGRVTLYLLDTNQPENDDEDREITGQLYGGDMEMRMRQEIILGIGGVHALDAMGINPDVCHLNEGHSAFLALERIRRLIATYGLEFDQAREQAAASHVFTTHTPVPAGIDRFPPELMKAYFANYHEGLKLDMEGLLALGRENVSAKNEFFSMAVLALRTANWCNGVSRLHGRVSRSMWRSIWPAVPEPEIPITHITNGVHARSWLSRDISEMLDRYLGARRWQHDPAEHDVWESINQAPDEELWRIRELSRHNLVLWARERLRSQLAARGENTDHVQQRIDALDPHALTIGFARRFATYKRGNLLLQDPKRLHAMLGDTDRPLQFLIAGKAHPADGPGKDLIRQLVHFASESDAGGRIVFLENYDIDVARYLVQGCDVWLNTPRRGMEASGTSGMKAALNGVINCSILDGWWDEAYDSELGWAIGRGETYGDVDTQDQIESQSLYDLLEKQIIPTFYDRDDHGVPRRWVQRMKQCIVRLAPVFNTNRMVQQYTERLYIPAAERARELAQDNLAGAIELAGFKQHLRNHWDEIEIEDVTVPQGAVLSVRDSLEVRVIVNLGKLSPDDVQVQVFTGPVDGDGRILGGHAAMMMCREQLGDGRYEFGGKITTTTSGRFGFAVRVVPGGRMLGDVTEPGMLLWDADSPPVVEQVIESQTVTA